MATKTYRPYQVTVTISEIGGGMHVIQDFAPGTFIEFEDFAPENTSHQSVQGNSLIVQASPIKEAIMKIRITQDSISNTYLNRLNKSARAGGSGFSVSLREPGSESGATSLISYVRLQAKPDFGDQPIDREWIIVMPAALVDTNGIPN